MRQLIRIGGMRARGNPSTTRKRSPFGSMHVGWFSFQYNSHIVE
jgi:hypothetical protein